MGTLISSGTGEDDCLVCQDMLVMRRNSPSQDVMLDVHLHSGNEVHPLLCPFTELLKIVVSTVQSNNSTRLEIDFVQPFTVVITGYCHADEFRHQVGVVQQHMELNSALFRPVLSPRERLKGQRDCRGIKGNQLVPELERFSDSEHFPRSEC